MKNDDRPADEIQKATDECNRLKEEYHAASKKETRQKNKKDKQAELKNDLEREPLYADFDPVRCPWGATLTTRHRCESSAAILTFNLEVLPILYKTILRTPYIEIFP